MSRVESGDGVEERVRAEAVERAVVTPTADFLVILALTLGAAAALAVLL